MSRRAFNKLTNQLLPIGSHRRQIVKKLITHSVPQPQNPNVHDLSYEDWIGQKEPKLISSDNKNSRIKPLISIVVPCFNTPQKYLEPMIESVLNQTYDNWQLCLADGSTDNLRQQAIKELSEQDRRILYISLKENFGIAGNTNAGINKAEGDYIAFLDHDDVLPEWALNEVVRAINVHPDADIFYSDEDYLSDDGKQRLLPFFKPDWSLDLFLSVNYLAHFIVIRRKLVDKLKGIRTGYDGAQDYDFLLRAIDYTDKIVHIPKILYHWRMASGSTARAIGEKNYADSAGRKALNEYLKRNHLDAKVVGLPDKPTTYRVKYALPSDTLVSIIVPFKDKVDLLKTCVASIKNKTTYKNYEIILISNNSVEQSTHDYLKSLKSDKKIKILTYNKPFNYSAINNYGRKYAKGKVLVFLNNDTEVINKEWLEELASIALQKTRGAIGALLFYPDNTIQHAGVVVGMVGAAGHVFRNSKPGDFTYFRSPEWPRNYLAVTGACLAIETRKFDSVGGFNESIIIAGSDVVLGLELYKKKFMNVYWPYAQLKHYESQSVGSYNNVPPSDYDISIEYYRPYLDHKDPYFNPNLELATEQVRLRNDYE